jgi:hypothetical protein
MMDIDSFKGRKLRSIYYVYNTRVSHNLNGGFDF